MPDDSALLRVLAEIQRRGAIGRGPLSEAVAHAEQFALICPVSGSLIDLGSGGGLPGLVIAMRLTGLRITLVERRATRADLLRYAVRALRLDDRVEVLGLDARRLPGQLLDLVDVVTARSFAPPLSTLAVAAPLVADGGMVLISDPPSGVARWEPQHLADLGFRDEGRRGGIRQFARCPR